MDQKLYYIIIALVVWTIPWKGFSLWKSARRGDRAWFIILLILNTAGLLEILYLFFFSERPKKIEQLNLMGSNNSNDNIGPGAY